MVFLCTIVLNQCQCERACIAVNSVEETYGVIVNFDGVTPLQLLAVQGDVTDVIADRTNSYCAMNETTFDECCEGFGDRCVLLNV